MSSQGITGGSGQWRVNTLLYATASLTVANDAVGVNSAVGAWAYQGSRAALSKGQILNAQGNYISSVRDESAAEPEPPIR